MNHCCVCVYVWCLIGVHACVFVGVDVWTYFIVCCCGGCLCCVVLLPMFVFVLSCCRCYLCLCVLCACGFFCDCSFVLNIGVMCAVL